MKKHSWNVCRIDRSMNKACYVSVKLFNIFSFFCPVKMELLLPPQIIKHKQLSAFFMGAPDTDTFHCFGS